MPVARLGGGRIVDPGPAGFRAESRRSRLFDSDTDTSRARRLSQVAAEFGAAYIRGDTEQSRTVELRNFDTAVEVHEGGTATATYRGERCSTRITSPTTTLGSAELPPREPAAPPPRSTVVCVDIAEQSTHLTPFTFQRIDGRWYPKLPELR